MYVGSKSGTLEMVGLLLPFLAQPEEVAGRHVVLKEDNIEVVCGRNKRYSKGDAETSFLIRCLHVLEVNLECKIYVTHVKRCSTAVAHSLSRKRICTQSI